MPDSGYSRFIFNNRTKVDRGLKITSLLFSVLSVGLILYFYGFPQTVQNEKLFIGVFEGIFSFYVLSFLIRGFFSASKSGFLKRNWFEFILMILLVYDVICLYLFGVPVIQWIFKTLGFKDFTFFYILFIQFYLLLFVGIDAVKFSNYLARFKIKTSAIFGLSFILLILSGTFMLMMPEMTYVPGSMNFWDALFTSVSSSCVTGLIVVDTATYFTFKGQLIIMLLFQIGGIGIITFALFFALFLRSGGGIQSQHTLQEILNTATLVASRSLLKQVILLTFTIEAIGALLLYWSFGSSIHHDDRLFFSIFHSISAFCNAGFSLFSNGLYQDVVRENYVLHWVVAAIIFFGSLGFPAIQDLFSPSKLRDRMKFRWRDWNLSTKIALYSSVLLVGIGTVLFYLIEWNNTMSNESEFARVTQSVFQSVTTRTAGFNTVDFSALQAPTLIFMMFFMFIGASSASTGGGIKTSTFVVIFLSVFATIRNRNKIELGHRTLSTELLNKAFSIFIFAATYVFLATFFISITDPDKDILNLAFEVISAFCTVGLSTGITADLSFWGKIIIMFSMYFGRVGILTLVVALSSAKSVNTYSYPKAHLMIG